MCLRKFTQFGQNVKTDEMTIRHDLEKTERTWIYLAAGEVAKGQLLYLRTLRWLFGV